MQIIVIARSSMFGMRLYPHCKAAKALAAFAGVRYFPQHSIKALNALGVRIVVVTLGEAS